MTQQLDNKTVEPMPLRVARARAEKIVDWLRPFCERIEIAGSIRRKRPLCNDVDLVVIPKLEVERDLLGIETGKKILIQAFLQGYVSESGGRAEWLAEGDRNLLLKLPKCQLDIWCAKEETWGTLLLCRTGSKEHNIWLAQRAGKLGKHWQPYRGMFGPGRVASRTEEDVYMAVGLPFIPPEEREAGERLARFR